MEDLKFPIGKFQLPQSTVAADRQSWIRDIADTPRQMRQAISGLSESQLDTPYRPEGWTVRQVVHHVPDSHMHSFLRMKYALADHEPEIKPYDEASWARLPDATAPVGPSLNLLDALHVRWMALLEAMRAEQFSRAFRHPELGLRTLHQTLALYSWHGRHHVAHITSLRKRMGW